MKLLGIRDLFVVTMIVAVHIAMCKAAVTYRHSTLTSLVLLAPTAITLWVHHRVACSWTAGSVIHYCITIVWAFFYGLTYSVFYIRRQPIEFFEKDSIGLEHPLAFATSCVEIYAMLGAVTSLLYGMIGYLVVTWVHRFDRVESTPGPQSKFDKPSVGPKTSNDSLGDG